MKNRFTKFMIAAGAMALICACGDDPSSPNNPQPGASSAVIDPNSSAVVPGSSTGIDPNSSAAVPGSSAVVPGSSETVPGSSTVVPGSSAVAPGSSAVVPGSSETVPVSSSSDVPRDENGFPTLESYGPPPEAYTKDILSNGKTGWSSRYWDACKPHCSWLSSVDTTSEAAYQAGGTVARNCNIHDVEVPAFTLGHAVQQYWMGYEGTNSACVNNNAGGTYTCTDMAPIQVNENLSYGYVAAPGAQFGGGCGKCFHLQFNGGNHANDVKATHKALKGKHMIVMASNIGYDVEAGQYDMLVPGGTTLWKPTSSACSTSATKCSRTGRTCCAAAAGMPNGTWPPTTRLTTGKKLNARSTWWTTTRRPSIRLWKTVGVGRTTGPITRRATCSIRSIAGRMARTRTTRMAVAPAALRNEVL